MQRLIGAASFVAGVLIMSGAFALTDAQAHAAAVTPGPAATPLTFTLAADTPNPDPISTPTPAPAPVPAPTATPTPAVHPSFDPLAASIRGLVAGSGAQVGVQLIELGGKVPAAWAVNSDLQFGAASDYKLVALMAEAQGIAAGTIDPKGFVCYEDADFEDGWFSDYTNGACFTRHELAQRAGLYSDNTAGHMLVRDIGGSDALNAFARKYGATGSDLFFNNTTTAHDLAVLWQAEAGGRLGGAPAQAWLYPVLTNTRYEAGIPSGLPAGRTAIHKTGEYDLEVNDAALVNGGPAGSYILVVLTDNLGDQAGWTLIAQISGAVAKYEAAR